MARQQGQRLAAWVEQPQAAEPQDGQVARSHQPNLLANERRINNSSSLCPPHAAQPQDQCAFGLRTTKDIRPSFCVVAQHVKRPGARRITGSVAAFEKNYRAFWGAVLRRSGRLKINLPGSRSACLLSVGGGLNLQRIRLHRARQETPAWGRPAGWPLAITQRRLTPRST